jgi:hypothetical protein
MENPPPYGHADKAPIAFAKQSPVTNITPAPTFHIRPISKSDSQGILHVNEHLKRHGLQTSEDSSPRDFFSVATLTSNPSSSLAMTRDTVAPLSKVEASIQVPRFQHSSASCSVHYPSKATWNLGSNSQVHLAYNRKVYLLTKRKGIRDLRLCAHHTLSIGGSGL